MRVLVVIAAALLAGCASSRPAAESSKPDPTAAAWYGEAVEQLTALARQGESLLQTRKPEQVAEIITKAQPLMNQLLSVPHPTLAAMEAVSDVDNLYARMLLANRHYGWARMLFQKNLSRWTNWQPQTPETGRRRKLAESGIAECDRRMSR